MILQTQIKQIKTVIAKPDHPFWRKVGNWAVLVGAPIGTLAILILVPDPYKQPSIAAWSAIMAAIKGGSKLTTK